MTADRLAQIEARVEAATPGPWWMSSGDRPDIYAGENPPRGVADDLHPDDAEFIAHAREDVPYLLARVKDAEAREDLIRADRDEVRREAHSLRAEARQAIKRANKAEAERDRLLAEMESRQARCETHEVEHARRSAAERARAEKAEAERDEFKRLFTECHPEHMRALATLREVEALAKQWAATAEPASKERRAALHGAARRLTAILARRSDGRADG